MPRKTRKQKIAAAKRLSSRERHVPLKNSEPVEFNTTLQIASIHSPKKPLRIREFSEADIALRNQTMRDIVRTCIVIGVIFSIQAGFYVAQQQGYLQKLFQ